MPRSERTAFLFALALPLAALYAADPPAETRPHDAGGGKHGEYDITRTIKIGTDSRWERPAFDEQTKLLYIPRNARTQVVDTVAGKVVGEIINRGAARGVALVPELHRGFITNGRDNGVTIFDLKTNSILGKITVEGDPAACVYDPISKRVLVCCPEGKCVVPIAADVDPEKGKPDPAIELTGKPTGIVSDGQGSVYVAIMENDEVALIGTKTMSLLTKWYLGNSQRPVGIALDDNRTRLFVGTRDKRLLVLSAIDGHEIAVLPLNANIESAMFGDGKLFVITQEGNLLVIAQGKDGKYEVHQTIKLDQETSGFSIDSKTGTLYVPTIETEGRKPIRDSFKVLVIEKK